MYKIGNFLIVFSFFKIMFSQNVIAQLGIKETNIAPNSAAMLDVESSSKGVLIPRLTTAQRNAIASPPAGLMIYNSTDNKYNYFNGSVWSEFVVGGFSLPFSATTDNTGKLFQIINQNLSNINSGAIVGRAIAGNGVEGISEDSKGVKGESYNGIGVYGANGEFGTDGNIGVKGVNNSTNGVAMHAVDNAGGNGIALEVSGPVKVSGSNKFVFNHFASVANKISANGTDINNPLCNNDPNAFLIVTQRVNFTGTVYNNSPIATYYNTTRNRWEILNQNNTPIPINAQFTVMVIKQ